MSPQPQPSYSRSHAQTNNTTYIFIPTLYIAREQGKHIDESKDVHEKLTWKSPYTVYHKTTLLALLPSSIHAVYQAVKTMEGIQHCHKMSRYAKLLRFFIVISFVMAVGACFRDIVFHIYIYSIRYYLADR